jgi:hypothetical protein
MKTTSAPLGAAAETTEWIYLPNTPFPPPNGGKGLSSAEKQRLYSQYRSEWWELNVRPFDPKPNPGRPK